LAGTPAEMVQELEATGQLQEALSEAEEKTKDEMEEITRKLMSEQGYTPDQAEQAAWEMVRNGIFWFRRKNHRVWHRQLPDHRD